LLSVGYYYNLTFVQLGLIDLGARLVRMSAPRMLMVMAVLAVSAFVIAAATGRLMDPTALELGSEGQASPPLRLDQRCRPS
jgi:hypothetical protein